MPFRFNRIRLLICGAALAAGLVWYWQADVPPAVVAVTATDAKSAWTGPIGVGTLRSNGTASAPDLVADLDEIPDGMVRVDNRGLLIVDVQLHNAIDSYLLHSDVPSRQIATDNLRAYLKRKLATSPSADLDAQALVTRYLTYIDQHDAALARMRFVVLGTDVLSNQSAEQFAAWLAQRKTLRQAVLGASVYKEWFAAEDARCAGLLAARPLQGDGAAEPASDVEQMHDALDCANESAKTFALAESEGRQWTRHLTQYREAVQRLTERDPTRRAQALATLRQQIFSNEAERKRALAMNLD